MLALEKLKAKKQELRIVLLLKKIDLTIEKRDRKRSKKRKVRRRQRKEWGY